MNMVFETPWMEKRLGRGNSVLCCELTFQIQEPRIDGIIVLRLHLLYKLCLKPPHRELSRSVSCSISRGYWSIPWRQPVTKLVSWILQDNFARQRVIIRFYLFRWISRMKFTKSNYRATAVTELMNICTRTRGCGKLPSGPCIPGEFNSV